jgi:hypothetical protein
MAKKPTTADAQLVLHLYELRRESEMRKARSWWGGEFFPQNADDYLKVLWAMNTPENAWLRQVQSYWGMAANFVQQGVMHEELFLHPSVSGEMFLILAKVYPFLKELRKKMDDPNVFLTIEKVATHTKWGRDRLQFIVKRVEVMRQKRTVTKAEN